MGIISSEPPTRKRSQEVEAGPSQPRTSVPPGSFTNGKRPRLSPDNENDVGPHRNIEHTDSPISDAALLYHTATSAHKASASHLQQAFLPAWIETRPDESFDTIPLYASPTRRRQVDLSPDRDAAKKALALQLLALDLLNIGLKRSDSSDAERAAFAIEFITVGMKVREASKYMRRKGKGKAVEGKVADERLVEDMQEVLAAAIAVCERSSQLTKARQHLEWLNVKLNLMENRIHAAKRTARQYLARCPKNEHAHSYALRFLLLDKAAASDSSEALNLIAEIQAIATLHNHRQVTQILALARCRLLFAYRRWDAIASCLEDISKLIHWVEESLTGSRLSNDCPIWHTTLTAHYLTLRSLWEGRTGEDSKTRGLLKRLYMMMDEAAESGSLEKLRASGGILEVKVGDQAFLMQATPPNALYVLIFLATVTSRRDFMGPASTCKNLVHIKAMREFENMARKDDMWDTGFAAQHGLVDVWRAQEGVLTRMAEVVLEEATAVLMRSDYLKADRLLDEFVKFARDHDILDALGPHLCLVHAMMAQMLGHDATATRYYDAASAQLTEGTELALLIEASLLGVKGLLQGAKDDHKRQSEVRELSAKCRRTSSMALNTIGQLLSALADDNLMTAKKKISGAYDLASKSNNNLLRALIFAFTSTTHLTGNEGRVQRQLETGLDIASMLGGKDRPDQVGQPVLGLWFSVRLKKLHHRNQDHLAFNIAKSKVQRYQLRLNEVSEYGDRKYAAKQVVKVVGH